MSFVCPCLSSFWQVLMDKHAIPFPRQQLLVMILRMSRGWRLKWKERSWLRTALNSVKPWEKPVKMFLFTEYSPLTIQLPKQVIRLRKYNCFRHVQFEQTKWKFKRLFLEDLNFQKIDDSGVNFYTLGVNYTNMYYVSVWIHLYFGRSEYWKNGEFVAFVHWSTERVHKVQT